MLGTDLIATAVDHLQRAASVAEATDPHLAGQIRLAAATLPGDPAEVTDAPVGEVANHLAHALDCLDQVPPLDGPADLQLCAWHIHELRRIATTKAAS